MDASGRGQIVWESGKRQGRRLFFFCPSPDWDIREGWFPWGLGEMVG